MRSEYLDIVDERDHVIGKETREKIHRSELWHRGIHVLILNPKGYLILQMRSAGKDKFPEHYDCSVSEHLEEGETYEAAAIRGLREELKITNLGLKRLMKFKMNYGPNDNMISELYECRYGGPTQVNRRETKGLKVFSTNGLREMLAKDEGRFAPWTKEILKWYLKMPSRLVVLYLTS